MTVVGCRTLAAVQILQVERTHTACACTQGPALVPNMFHVTNSTLLKANYIDTTSPPNNAFDLSNASNPSQLQPVPTPTSTSSTPSTTSTTTRRPNSQTRGAEDSVDHAQEQRDCSSSTHASARASRTSKHLRAVKNTYPLSTPPWWIKIVYFRCA